MEAVKEEARSQNPIAAQWACHPTVLREDPDRDPKVERKVEAALAPKEAWADPDRVRAPKEVWVDPALEWADLVPKVARRAVLVAMLDLVRVSALSLRAA